jgi:hypothetical protein
MQHWQAITDSEAGAMSGAATVVISVVAAYVAAGIVTALLFLIFGVLRVLPQPASVTTVARILLFPGAVALWPLVLVRWLQAGRTP